jgi:teichuronic acid biosynthesis glycosyltransferase TuaH
MSAHVVVGVGSRFAELEGHATRWRAVLLRWAGSPRVRSLTVVDYPRFGRRMAAASGRSWLPGTQLVHLDVPGRVAGGPLPGLAWRVAAARLERQLPGTARDRALVVATPLSAPLLRHVPAATRLFDAVDDWRALPSAQRAARRVDDGYRAARAADAVTAVSPVLADRLRADYGLDPVVVGNGVETGPVPPLDPAVAARLPTGSFVVYTGSVQERVDLTLLAEVARRTPVVVAGPATSEAATAMTSAPGLTWLGPLAPEQVRALLRHASVGVLPHHVDALTESMAPMKALDYAAAGLPVVGTPLPGLRDVPAARAVDRSGFVDACVAALTSRPGTDAAWLAQHDWDRRAEELLEVALGGQRVKCAR